MKSELQVRAELAARRFRTEARRPAVVEFSGTPKAGKTSTLGQVQALLKRCGFRVEVVVERASVCPIRDKRHFNFNVWTACTTLAQLLEKTQLPGRPEDPDLLIIDRGLFDAICWLRMMKRLSRIREQDLTVIEQFLRLDDWRERIDAVIVMTASPEDALRREKGLLPLEDAVGSIMNAEVLHQMTETTRNTAKEFEKEFKIHMIDTSEPGNSPQKSAERAVTYTLEVIEDLLQEQILSMPKSHLAARVSGRTTLPASEVANLAEDFSSRGSFAPRAGVEADAERVQALPVVVVRNRSGHVLQLRRKETSAANKLNDKLVIWAGGHVRKEDKGMSDALRGCAVRELQEELRLSVEPEELLPLGVVYVPEGEKTSKHVAIVYEWRAQTDDVAIVLSTAEFFERRGTSLSGKFVEPDELRASVSTGKICEPWSKAIISRFLA